MDDKEIGEGLFEAENRNLKKKKKRKEEKKTKHFVGKELSTEEKDLATLGPNTTFTTQGFWLKKKKPHTFHYSKKASYTKLYKILNIS